jgi:hypothetical protein
MNPRVDILLPVYEIPPVIAVHDDESPSGQAVLQSHPMHSVVKSPVPSTVTSQMKVALPFDPSSVIQVMEVLFPLLVRKIFCIYCTVFLATGEISNA